MKNNRDKILASLVKARSDVDKTYLAVREGMLRKELPTRLLDMLDNEHKRALHEMDARIQIEEWLQKQLQK